MKYSRMFFVGRNYLKHIQELKNKVPKKPLLFLKPLSSLGHEARNVYFPSYGKQLQQEAEVVIKIGKSGKPVGDKECREHIEAITLGLDMTLRDIQQEAKEKGEPWDEAKGFDDATKIAQWKPVEDSLDLLSIHFSCHINGEIKQEGNTAEMMTSILKLVEYVGSKWTLEKGDIIFTGTPAGVCNVEPGDTIRLSSEDLDINEEFTIKPRIG